MNEKALQRYHTYEYKRRTAWRSKTTWSPKGYSVVLGTINGIIKILDLTTKAITATWGQPNTKAQIQELSRIGHNIYAVIQTGQILKWNYLTKAEEILTINFKAPVTGFQLLDEATEKFLLSGADGTIEIRSFSEPTESITFSTRRPIDKMRYNAENNQFVIIARSKAPEVWDLKRKHRIWKAKNVPLDKFYVEVPWMDKDVFWLNPQQFVTCTIQHHEIRVYDLKQKDPIIRKALIHVSDNIHIIRPAPDNKFIAMANGEGGFFVFVPEGWRMHGRLKSVFGAIRDVQWTSDSCAVIATGLDRRLYVFDRWNRNCIENIYVKQRMNRLLIIPPESPKALKPETKTNPDVTENQNLDDEAQDESNEEDDGDDGDDGNESDEEVWRQIRALSGKKRKVSEGVTASNPTPTKKPKKAKPKKSKFKVVPRSEEAKKSRLW